MNGSHLSARTARGAALAASLGLFTVLAAAAAGDRPFIPNLDISSTIPANGDINPYGIAFVPAGFPAGGRIAAGDVLVANFNNSSNLQGTGTTIIQFTPSDKVAPSGSARTFFQGNLPGLTTALGVLKGGFVVVGNLPAKYNPDGSVASIGQGSLEFLDRQGNVVSILSDPVFFDGPWDLTIADNGDRAQLFVSNVLNGTVSRVDLAVEPGAITVQRVTLVATGYLTRTDPAALVVGPTGLAFDEKNDTLYVAATGDNAIFAVAHAGRAMAPAGTGRRVFSDPHLRGPLALALAPNGHLLTANGDAVNPDPTHPSEIIEFTRQGEFVREFSLDPGQGAAFGIATNLEKNAPFNLALVNDVTNAVVVYGLATKGED